MLPILLAGLLLLGQLGAAPQMEAGTGVIRGRVTDRESGEPIPRAVVSLHMAAGARHALTGPDGRYEFTNVPAGQVMVSAYGGEFRATHVEGSPTASPGSSSRALKAGEVRTGVDIALARAVALSGRVVGPRGQPLSGVQVRLTRTDGAGGAFLSGRTTDDRGSFRLFGLASGRYYVCAIAAPASTAPLRSAAPLERYITTCHPDARSEADALAVTVANADLEGVEIRMLRSRSYTIEGVVLDADGQPAPSVILGLEGDGSRGTTSFGGRNAAGEFTFGGVIPGRYTITAQASRTSGPAGLEEMEAGYATVTVDQENVQGVVLTLKRAARIAGRITFDGAAEPPAMQKDRAPFSVEARRDPASFFSGRLHHAPGRVRDDQTFEIAGLVGPVRFSVSNPPGGWMLAAVRYRGHDITDVATEFPSGLSEVEIVLTDRGARLAGSVLSDRAAPLAGVPVVLFPADPARWEEVASYEVTTRTTKDGRFMFGPRRAGDYLVVALDPTVVIPSGIARAFFERMAQVAERVTLLESDRRTIDLRIATLPEDRR